jgi:16S rRNA (uracil1498-N3)-methyltransferase
MSTHRFFLRDVLLAAGAELELPPAPARHVMVRRLQPGDALLLFSGDGVDWPAEVRGITRQSVRVQLAGAAQPAAAAELPFAVTLAFGMPANERMDVLVEKAAELGATALQPLVTERSVLRLAGERAQRRVAHWQGVAEAACEQCGRARVPQVRPVLALQAWLQAVAKAPQPPAPGTHRYVLSTAHGAPALRLAGAGLQGAGSQGAGAPAVQPVGGASEAAATPHVVLLSGPEGGLAPGEMGLAGRAGFAAVSLGPRILRADTAPLAALAWLALDSA